MLFADGARPDPGAAAQRDTMDRSERYHEWVSSNPATGEALVDTGLSSAADCQKLRWSLSEDQRDQFSRLLARSVMHDRGLSRPGGLEAEAKRINDLAGPVLKEAGLDPEAFGISMPPQLSADAPVASPVARGAV
jgi:uncharacterized protein with von Willebrand factor type A (vWA) domain